MPERQRRAKAAAPAPLADELVGSVLDPGPPPSLAGWMLPCGPGKSAMVAALGLCDLMRCRGRLSRPGRHGRAAGRRCVRAAARMVAVHSGLGARVQVYQDRLAVPARGATVQVLPACRWGWKGLDRSWRSWTSSGVMSRDEYDQGTPGMRRPCSAARLAGRGGRERIVRYWPRWSGCCRKSCACGSPRRRPCRPGSAGAYPSWRSTL